MAKLKTFLNYTWQFIKWFSRLTWGLLKNKNTYKVLAILLLCYLCYWFGATYKIVSPIKEWQNPIQRRYNVPPKTEKRKEGGKELKPEATQEFFDGRVSDIIAKIKVLESNNGTKGLAVECKNKGMVNNVGYLVTPDFCFENEEIEILTLSRWFTKCLKNKTLEACLCKYNLGVDDLINCKYYQKYLSL